MSDSVNLSTKELEMLSDQMADRLFVKLEQRLAAEENQIVGREQLAAILRLGVATIDRMVKKNQIPSTKIGSRRLFNLPDVIKAIAENDTEKGADSAKSA